MTEEVAQQFAGLWSNVILAFEEADRKHREQIAIHKAVLESIPKKPKRGSYYWWAGITRQYTGSHFLDSGGAYGYNYMRGIRPENGPHMWLDMWNGVPQYWSITLAKWLESTFDADSALAISIENVLYWASNWLYPRESYDTVIDAFPDTLSDLYGCIVNYETGPIFCKRKKINILGITTTAEMVVQARYKQTPYYDLQEYQREMSEDEFVAAALKALPANDVKAMYMADVKVVGEGRDVYDNPGTFYTYNYDNDFDQDFLVVGWLTDSTGTLYALVETHNGCDARGGFSSPVVAECPDVDYLFDWQADGNCFNCDEQWDSIYRYGEDVEKNPPEFDTEKFLAALAKIAEIEAGQLQLEGIEEWHWPFDGITQKEVVAILAYMKEDGEENDLEWGRPPVVFECERDGYVHASHDNNDIPDSTAALYCPQCKTYNVRFWSSVYGH